jgi:hypothetical protein
MKTTDITNMSDADLDAILGMTPDPCETAVAACFVMIRKLAPYVTRYNRGHVTPVETLAGDVVTTCRYAGLTDTEILANPDGATRTAWDIWESN